MSEEHSPSIRIILRELRAENKRLRDEIGMPPVGAHPDEVFPRASTWHHERLNWQAEVKLLRDTLSARPDAPAGDARDDEQDVEYIAAQLSNELGLSFRPRDTARKIIDLVVALRSPAIASRARAEGAAEERESCLELVRAHIGATVSGRKLAGAIHARAPSSGTEERP